jgi:inner membrane protein
VAQNPMAGLIPRGSLGLKLLLVCLLVLVMGIPLLLVGSVLSERQGRANQVITEVGNQSGGAQSVGGPMLLVPYQRVTQAIDDQGRATRRLQTGHYVIFAASGTANATLAVQDRQKGIYRAATYNATTDFTARFRPIEALRGVDQSYVFDWSKARITMFVRDSRTIRDVAELHFSDGSTAALEPFSELNLTGPVGDTTMSMGPGDRYPQPQVYADGQLQGFAAPAPFTAAPEEFSVTTQLVIGGAQRFSIAAFAQDTQATISGNRQDVSAAGYFQTQQALETTPEGFSASWRIPFAAQGEKAADLAVYNLGGVAGRDMAVSFVSSDNLYQGVARAIRYGILFIGIIFMATLIFEAVSGKKAHPAQYILVGLAQCVFYLLLLSITEIIGFQQAFAISATATILLLAYYAGASSRSASVGASALGGLVMLYGAMYVLLTLEDFALLAGSLVAFTVIAATMIATRRIDWYGRGAAEARAA